ncbi:alpha-amylase family glycosyl hydrolase [uncultured Treponema sp.]|uniref:alpha-amylase family glycosyl hydrolase n=1 Tax=uncultured Treponema sp. TaxID=162155 RepID=UPI002589AB4F|nr:alpha-amylase family glycosyl hydrolase [uncultured Treponema sp.]
MDKKYYSDENSAELIDSAFYYDGNDLGLTLNGTSASFKCWAPTASNVRLLLFKDSAAKKICSIKQMERKEKGVWFFSGSYEGCSYYQYEISFGTEVFKVADIWHTVAAPDSVASQIAVIEKLEYKNPFKENDYSKAVIYEMHIRDWSRAVNPASTGKFLEVADPKIISHLKELGVTHVQILPMFDYAQKNSDLSYNWGYNPFHYNVPEGRYVSQGYTDGIQAVKEMQQMVKSFHDAGIAVIMDVVYNHTDGTQNNSLYDMTVPKYFYRLNSECGYSNGSGCGNEIATNHKMVKKYVLDSLKHWMKDFHINGFRFDLMGVQEQETMSEIFCELKKIDPYVMVYGEPWTGGECAVKNGCSGSVACGKNCGVGAFNDDFRDAIKGSEFGGFAKGQVQGIFCDSEIEKGLLGATGKNNRNPSGIPSLSINYVECHDNYTLFDKLAISYLGKTSYSGNLFETIGNVGLEKVKRQGILAAAYIILAQGTPFINGGQEFLRTKQGDENSYISSDEINQINLDFKTRYSDVFNAYKGLIAFRRENADSFGSKTDCSAMTIFPGLTKYTVGNFCIYFNATDSSAKIDFAGFTNSIEVLSGKPEQKKSVPHTVDAKSFVILKKPD